MSTKLGAIKASLMGKILPGEIRLASNPPGSGAAQMGRWSGLVIVGLTANTIIITHDGGSGRRTSIRVETGTSKPRSYDVITALEPKTAELLRAEFEKLVKP